MERPPDEVTTARTVDGFYTIRPFIESERKQKQAEESLRFLMA